MKHTFEITKVVNGDTPAKEQVWLKTQAEFNTKGFALVDRTFDQNGKVSNEFRHIYVFPEVKLQKDQVVIVFTGTGTNGLKKFGNVDEEYYALYWGADHCVWNNKGGDSATLISYAVVNTVKVPAFENKKA